VTYHRITIIRAPSVQPRSNLPLRLLYPSTDSILPQNQEIICNHVFKNFSSLLSSFREEEKIHSIPGIISPLLADDRKPMIEAANRKL